MMREQKKARTSINDDLSIYSIPEDITTQILCRLPMKSIARFKCVAKYWNSFISSTTFKNHHLQHQLSNKYLICQSKHELFLKRLSVNVENPKKSNFVLSDLKHGYETLGYDFLVGSCNGLVCICIINSNHGRQNILFLVWNPTTQEKRLIPGPGPIELKGRTNICCYGFGYDKSSDDYKIVILCIHEKSRMSSFSFTYLFTFKNNYWKKLDVVWFPISPHDFIYVRYYYDVQVIVGERLYWLIQNGGIKGNNYLILEFDLAKESYSSIPLPPMDDLYDEDKLVWQDFLICEFDGCLCFGRTVAWCRYNNTPTKSLEVWMLEKHGVWDSWKLLCHISSEHEFLKMKPLTLYPRLFEFGNNNNGQGSLSYVFGYSGNKSARIEFRLHHPLHHPCSLEQVHGLPSLLCAVSSVESFVSPYYNCSRTQRKETVKSIISLFINEQDY